MAGRNGSGAEPLHRVTEDLAVGRELLEDSQAAAGRHHHGLVAGHELLVDEA